ncbi:MFS transporter [Cellulosimicrobium cellulans]|nr:MFS transporter [Cellulosimicrobium cellulans]
MLQFFIAVDVTVVNVALPAIGHELGGDPRRMTWVIVGYTITGGGLLMLGGRLGDVLGRRRVLVLGTALFGAASVLAGAAWSLPVLVAARLLQGAGEALALPAAMAVIVLLFPEGPRRARALGVWAGVASCGLVVGFVLSGVITELLGWRWVFLVAVPFVVLVLVAAIVLVPADPQRERRPLDLAGSALLTAAPLLFAAGATGVGEGAPGTRWLAVAALLAAVVAAALFVRVERHVANPLVPPSFFRHRVRVLANLATALLSAALSTSFVLLTYHLQRRLGLSPLAAGLTLVPLGVSLVVVAAVVPRALDRWGPRACMLAGITSTASGVAAVALCAHLGAPAAAAVPAMVLIAAGMGFGIVGLQYAAVTGATDEDAGVAAGAQRAADQLGGSAGIAAYVGVGFAPAFAGATPYVVSGALAVAGLVVAGLVAARIDLPAAAPATAPERRPAPRGFLGRRSARRR